MKLGHKTKSALTKCKGLSQHDHDKFQRHCRLILKSMVDIILEKYPLKYPLVRYISLCDPALILKNQTLDRLSRTQIFSLTRRVHTLRETDFRRHWRVDFWYLKMKPCA